MTQVDAMLDLVSIGEALIDFTPMGTTDPGSPLYAANAGGGPANLAVATARLGSKVGFLGKAGNDPFGCHLLNILKQEGIDTTGFVLTDDCHTSLAFIHLTDTGDRTFTFYRAPGADELFDVTDIRLDIIDRARCLHFSSVAFTHETARKANLHAAQYAKTHRLLVSFDPNWRPMLWSDREAGIAAMRLGLPLADIVKVTPEELVLLSGNEDKAASVEYLFSQGVSVVFLTRGPDGSTVYTKEGHVSAPVVPVRVVDTTGAGDACLGAFLHGLLSILHDTQLHSIPLETWGNLATCANAAASLEVSRYGGIPAMPDRGELLDFMREQKVPVDILL